MHHRRGEPISDPEGSQDDNIDTDRTGNPDHDTEEFDRDGQNEDTDMDDAMEPTDQRSVTPPSNTHTPTQQAKRHKR